MNETQIEDIRARLFSSYPGCRVKAAEDKQELVAEIRDRFAVAVIERSRPHFHLRTREIYRALKGTLLVACGGRGHVLREGESLAIEPGLVHHARAVGDPAWIEVVSEPEWSEDDHFVM